MTSIKPALIDADLLTSAEWCDYSGNLHRDAGDEADDFAPAKEHVIEFDRVVARSSERAPGTPDQPYVLVCVTVPEKTYYDHGRLDDPLVTLAGTIHPHLTPSEARQLAATLNAAADRADEMREWLTPRSRAA